MKKIIAVMFAVAVIPTLFAQQGDFNYQSDAAQRKEKILNYYATLEGKQLNMYQIVIKANRGQDIDRCRADFIKALDNPTGEMFFTIPMMACYLYGNPIWTNEIKEKAKNYWKANVPYRGDTENHWLMWHVALLLAAQTWPDMTADEWANGRSSKENYEDAKGFINSWFDSISTIGQGEFNSPWYLMEYFGALFLLHDFVKDPVMKQKTEMAIDWMLADYAINYLHGAYTGGHSRCYDRELTTPYLDGAGVYGYIFFGDTQFPSKNSISFAVFAALSKYSMPQVIYDVANDRSKPYVAYDRKRVRNVIRFGDVKNPPVYKTNYMSDNFSVACLDGGLQQPIQTHTWGITYVYDDKTKNDEIFSIHPYYSDLELGMFFPERLKIMIGEVVKSKATYNNEDKWTGGSLFERTFQNRNVIMGLYDLDKNTPFKHIDFYFPLNLTKKEAGADGWIFCQGGNAYIAIRPFKEGTWKEEATCNRLRSPGLRNGYVAEAFESADFKSWDDFKTKIISSTNLDLSSLDKDASVTYTTTSGDVMKFQYPDKRYLNGNYVDLSKMPLFDNPFMKGNDKVLTVKYGSEELIIDYNKNQLIYQGNE